MIDDLSIKRTKPLFSLADQLFNEESVARLSQGLKKSHRRFDAKGFEAEVLRQFPDLELKQRIAAMVNALEQRLPDDFSKAVGVLQKALPEPLDPNLNDDDFGEFIWGVPAEYVARHGVTEDRLEISLPFLREATMHFTAENAIRPFLKTYPEQTLAFVHECAAHDNYHVRRLASEGIRPLLPWAPKVVLPAEMILEVLDRLHADTTRYVTRSVANNLNDLSKSDPELVLARLHNWASARKQKGKELNWMTRHALRTLLKKGHAEALEFVGYPSAPEFWVSKVKVTESVTIGEKLRWQGVLTSRADQKLRIGLDIHFRKSDGSHSPKLFAVADVAMARGERLDIDKSIAFKPLSTRTLYPGVHHVALKVNGIERARKSFNLIAG